ncbi:MAG: tail fiber domain-containing protein, partial [Flavobacteriales bacterium]|nr:tail fiber domain-containing protein [Flavobacteriales bacterium]
YSPIGGEPLTIFYIETHDALTNEFGLVNVAIGLGQPELNAFSDLQWGQDEYYLTTEVDLGNGWVETGTQQLLSVPFAERAERADELAYPVWRINGNDDSDDFFHYIGTNEDEDLVFKTNLIENMRIDHQSGNVGIGTASPGNAADGLGFAGKCLHVESPDNVEAKLLLSQVGDAGTGTNVTAVTHSDGNFSIRNYSTDGYLQMALGASNDPVMRIVEGEMLVSSVNESSLFTKLRCPLGVTSRLNLQNNTSGTLTTDGAIMQLFGSNMEVRNAETGSLYLATGPSGTAMTITAADEVGIGTLSPVTQLHIEGGTDASATSHGYLVTGSISGTNIVIDNNEIMARDNGVVSQLYLNANGGNVSIGTTGAVAFGLYVDGTAAKPGGGSWLAASDARLKENVNDFHPGLSEIMEVNPITYHYIANSGNDPSTEHVGVIAQDLREIAPEMVKEFTLELQDGTTGTYFVVDPSAFTYMLINAVQELKSENDALKKEMETRLSAIEKKLEQ